MLAWRYSALIALAVFVLSLLILGLFKFRKNLYYKAYVQDDNFKTDKVGGTKNKFYLEIHNFKEIYTLCPRTTQVHSICPRQALR